MTNPAGRLSLWTLTTSSPRGIRHTAAAAEEAGFDGLYVVDSQNLSGDAYVALAMAATVTEKLGLGTGVTNSVTRAAAVTASAIESVQRISGGRAVLGIGRGDSALAHLGRAPARVGQFERYVRVLMQYLAGESVRFSEIDIPDQVAPPIESLHLAEEPTESRIGWIESNSARRVPVEIAATGPKVIGIAARLCDRVMFTLGAEPERIRWGIDLARTARLAAGQDPDAVNCGAFVNLACHPDVAVARSLVRGGLTTFARFSVMHGDTAGPLDESQREVLSALHDRYDMTKHTRPDSRQAELMTDEFVDRFAIAGPPDYCIRRLKELRAAGIEKIAMSGPAVGGGSEQARVAGELLIREVLPALR